jgi:hypothetical protein
MITRFFPAALICALAFSNALPASAVTAAPIVSGDYHLRTAITEVYGSPYPTSGDLDLHITPGGLVSGYYHPAFVRSFIPIVGGLAGNRIWFDILGVTRLRVSGTMNADGSIDGGAWTQAIWPAAISTRVSSATLGADGGDTIPGQFKFVAILR